MDAADPEKKRTKNANDVSKDRQIRATSESHFDSRLNWDVKKLIFKAVVDDQALAYVAYIPRPFQVVRTTRTRAAATQERVAQCEVCDNYHYSSAAGRCQPTRHRDPTFCVVS